MAKQHAGDGRWRGHVLVAEGEDQVACALVEILSNDHDVEIETQPDDIIRRIEGGDEFDVILCDVRILESMGPERWAKLTVEHPGPVARIVFMTDGATSEPMRASLAMMSNLCIRRPFNVDGMRALVWRRMARERWLG